MSSRARGASGSCVIRSVRLGATSAEVPSSAHSVRLTEASTVADESRVARLTVALRAVSGVVTVCAVITRRCLEEARAFLTEVT